MFDGTPMGLFPPIGRTAGTAARTHSPPTQQAPLQPLRRAIIWSRHLGAVLNESNIDSFRVEVLRMCQGCISLGILRGGVRPKSAQQVYQNDCPGQVGEGATCVQWRAMRSVAHAVAVPEASVGIRAQSQKSNNVDNITSSKCLSQRYAPRVHFRLGRTRLTQEFRGVRIVGSESDHEGRRHRHVVDGAFRRRALRKRIRHRLTIPSGGRN
mmetsp:Transcript_120093/g.339813  ORF Transcript_120093/g.339813 Transcript_120093/m.339813 type:complete len:211 (+) Transcript_120093:89-721(+)